MPETNRGCHILVQADEQRRLKTKLIYLGTGALFGAIFLAPVAPRNPVAARLAGALLGQVVGWTAHGFVTGRWFI